MSVLGLAAAPPRVLQHAQRLTPLARTMVPVTCRRREAGRAGGHDAGAQAVHRLPAGVGCCPAAPQQLAALAPATLNEPRRAHVLGRADLEEALMAGQRRARRVCAARVTRRAQVLVRPCGRRGHQQPRARHAHLRERRGVWPHGPRAQGGAVNIELLRRVQSVLCAVVPVGPGLCCNTHTLSMARAQQSRTGLLRSQVAVARAASSPRP